MADEISDFEEVVRQIHAELADDSLEAAVFSESLDMAILTPRFIFWLPTTFTTQLPRSANVNSTNVLLTDYLTVECYICTESHYLSQELRRRVITVCRKLYGAGVVPANGVWVNQIATKTNGGERLQVWGGGCILQRFVWQMDVTRSDDTYPAHVRQIDIVNGNEFTTTVDGVLTPDEQMEITE